MSVSRLSPYAVYLVFSGASSFFFTVFATLSGVYRFQTAGLDPLQLVLVGTALELTVFLFEVPTGIVADVYSRRRSVIIGMVLIGSGFVLEGALPVFATMLLAQVVWGLGATFESGAVDAWVSDELGAERAGDAYLRASQVAQVASLLGVGVAVALGGVSLGLPLIVGGTGFLGLALFLWRFMPERGFTPASDTSHNPLTAMRATFSAGLEGARRKPVILTVFAITAFLGASSETFDRLSEAHFLADIGLPEVFTPVVWFGLINVVVSLLTVATTEVVRRTVDTNSHLMVGRTLLVINVLLTVCVIAFGVAGSFLIAVAFYFASLMFRRVNGPLFRAWLNQNLASGTRATVFSINGQMDALGQVVGGPLLGLVAVRSLPLAFVVAGLLLLPASFLYLRTLKKGATKTEASASQTVIR